ncbi:hypothetical protein B0T10DRAFT_140861 [Thelonectria olida]|uniref:Uncharacterized protein n=1 Tax=Thelonectria olida TaxID=1576542 RepID=A0A9P9AKM5_9HYPO|nr:hypothetical protein B0T10DRAFT_140861 [Thelonectria olida]
MSVSLHAISQSETGDVITMNTLSNKPKPFTVIHKCNMTPPTTAYETDLEDGPRDEIESPTVVHERDRSGNEPQDEDKGLLNTLLLMNEKGAYGTMCYQRGEINWVNLVNGGYVRVSNHLQGSFQALGLAMKKAPGAVLELEAGLKTKREEAVEVFLRLLRWSLNDGFKHRTENQVD